MHVIGLSSCAHLTRANKVVKGVEREEEGWRERREGGGKEREGNGGKGSV